MEEIQKEVKKFLELNEDENATYPKGKVYTHECIKKNTDRSQINDLMLHLKLLEEQEQAKLKASRGEK
jgi:hypothetical protein